MGLLGGGEKIFDGEEMFVDLVEIRGRLRRGGS